MRIPLALAAAVLLAAPLPGLLAAPAPAGPALDCAGSACNVLVAAGAAAPQVAVDPADPQRVLVAAVVHDVPGGEPCGARHAWVSVHASRDGGRAWASRLAPGHPAAAPDPAGLAALLATCLAQPSVGFGPGGRALLAAQAVHRLPDGAELAGVVAFETPDGGLAWTESGIVAPPGTGPLGAADPVVVLDVAPGFVAGVGYVGYTLGQPGVPALGRSLEGVAWSPPTLALETFPPALLGGGRPHPVQGGGHDLYFTWVDGDRVLEAVSLDFGTTWEHIVEAGTVDPARAPWGPLPPTVSTAVDRAGAPPPFYAAWADQRGGSPAVLAARSLDNGHVFEGPFVVSDAAAGARYAPALAAGPGGMVHAAWYDGRNDPSGALVDVYYARSGDGRTWGPNLRVSEASFDPALSTGRDGAPLAEPRIGLAVGSDGVAHLAWTDTRSGAPAVAAARVLP